MASSIKKVLTTPITGAKAMDIVKAANQLPVKSSA
jgi:hypothetical protein